MRDDLMVQQQVKSKWQHMVGVICLNQTYRKQVKQVLPELFKRYPNPVKFIRGRVKTQERILKPLGMWKVRVKRLRGMSCLLYTSPSPRDSCASRMPSSA